MGYTHYFEQNRHLTAAEAVTLAGAVVRILDACDVPLAFEYDNINEPPAVTDALIRFNGIGEDGHETFLVEAKGSGFQFCKTAGKPYDVAVVATLCALDAIAPRAFDIQSDGDEVGWEEGLQLARRACPELTLAVPEGV